MEYVLAENGNIKIGPNGQPMVKNPDGSEHEIDAIGAQAKITGLVKESNDRRKKLGDATTALEAFVEIEDPVAAIEALQTVAGFDDKMKLKVDEIKNTVNKAWKLKEEAWNTEKKGLQDSLFISNTGSKFATSKVIDGLVLTPDIAQAYFGKHFGFDGTATDASGQTIYSKERPGEPASFDEAMTHLINEYPNKNDILKSFAGDGSGGHQSGDGGEGQVEGKSSHTNIKEGLAARGK